MSPLKALVLCATLGLSLFSINLLVQGISGFASSLAWWMILVFAGFTIWLFLKLLLSPDKTKLQ
ncbi:hypothetical protein EON83_08620 [bacterium]|nr:MAG: hypothetical protein EON83_08620 [bacterium]